VRILVNGALQGTAPDGATIGEILESLRRSASSEGRVLGIVLLDGRPLSGDFEAEARVRPANGFACLDAQVTGPRELVRGVFSGLRESLPSIRSMALETGDRLRLGDPAGPAIGRLAEHLSFLMDAYKEGEKLLAANGRTWEAPHSLLGPPDPPEHLRARDGTRTKGGRAAESLVRVLNEVAAGLAADDPVRTGDALEHELVPVLDALGGEIREWEAILSSSAPPAGRESEART
jgi:hypothetical protein